MSNNKYLGIDGVSHLWSAITSHDEAVLTSATNLVKGLSLEYDSEAKKILLKGTGVENVSIDASEFVKDGVLSNVAVVEATPSNPILSSTSGKFIQFIWNTDAGNKDMYLPVEDFAKTYVDSDSIAIGSDNTINVKKVDASKTTLGGDIKVAGGPLANNIVDSGDEWPWKDSEGNNIIPQGKSMEEILTGLFLKVINGTVVWGDPSWNASINKPTITLSSNGPVEVGTKIKVSALSAGSVSGGTRSVTCTASQGYFDTTDGTYNAGNKTISVTGTTSGTASLACTWNGNAVSDVVVGTTEFVVNEGTNTFKVSQSGQKAHVEALPTTTVYASTNTKSVLADVSATYSENKPDDKVLSNSNTDTIKGQYKYFIGCYSDSTFANKEYSVTSVRTTDMKKSDWMNGKTVSYTITVPAGTKGMYIAIPAGIDDAGSSLKVKQVNTNAYVNAEMVDNKRTLSLTCGGDHTKDYVIFSWSFPGGTTGEEPFEITSF